MGLKQEHERIYLDMKGRIATNTKKQNVKYTSEMINNAEEYKRKYENLLKYDGISLATFRQLKYNEPERYWLLKG